MAKITPEWFAAVKKRGEKIPALTAYDYPMARLLDEAEIPVLLVGDSLGMVVLGYEDTTQVTLADMIHHTSAVARAKPHGMIVSDLPIGTYKTPEAAVKNAKLLVQAGAEGVKLEGGESQAAQVRAIVSAGIPVMGHIGMLPQSVKIEGGYKMKGRQEEEKVKLLRDSRALADAGVFAMVLELVMPDLARQISKTVQVPTIGIGSGQDCDGQILVTHDLVGAFPWFKPRFAKSLAQTGAEFKRAAKEYRAGVLRGREAELF
jgi:3-methyl-2-oxobutanoate hydroxymethyltransferase